MVLVHDVADPGVSSLMNKFYLLLIGGIVLSAPWRANAAQPLLSNSILFVTQPLVPDERNDNIVSNVFVSVVSGMGNHLTDTTSTPRGGDLYIRYADGTLKNLTRVSGYGLTGPHHTNAIPLPDP